MWLRKPRLLAVRRRPWCLFCALSLQRCQIDVEDRDLRTSELCAVGRRQGQFEKGRRWLQKLSMHPEGIILVWTWPIGGVINLRLTSHLQLLVVLDPKLVPNPNANSATYLLYISEQCPILSEYLGRGSGLILALSPCSSYNGLFKPYLTVLHGNQVS